MAKRAATHAPHTPPDPVYDRVPGGGRATFPDGVVLGMVRPEVDRSGRIWVEVIAHRGETVVNDARIDLLDQRHRLDYHAVAFARDGRIDWQSRLLSALPHVQAQLADQGTEAEGTDATTNPWARAIPAPSFLTQEDGEALWLVDNLVAVQQYSAPLGRWRLVITTAELWDPCVDPALSPLLPMRQQALFVGVDAAIKHDTAAVVSVRWVGDKLVLAAHRIWHPSPGEPLDLEDTIEAYLRGLHQGYQVKAILCDPYQLHRSITTLQAAHLPIREFPQTTGNTTLMGQTLFDLLTGRNLACYPSEELRQQALNTVVIEHARGWRIAKEKASKKIDAIVALALACVAAIESPSTHVGPRIRCPWTPQELQRMAIMRPQGRPMSLTPWP